MKESASVQVAVDNPRYRITYETGGGGLAVVAFAGIGLKLGGIQTEEFRASLAQHRNSDDISVIYVIDQRRGWYNDGVFEPIAEAVNGLLGQFGAREVVTLGNSMGGFGAIVYARRLNACARAVAFCPQSSVCEDVAPFELRWEKWRRSIAAWDVRDAIPELDGRIRYELFFGRDNATDVLHADRFRASGCDSLRLHMVDGCGHDVAKHLKRQGKLQQTLYDTILNPPGVRAGVAAPA